MRCFVCNTQTSGIFSPAVQIIARANNQKTKSKYGRGKETDSDDSDLEVPAAETVEINDSD